MVVGSNQRLHKDNCSMEQQSSCLYSTFNTCRGPGPGHGLGRGPGPGGSPCHRGHDLDPCPYPCSHSPGPSPSACAPCPSHHGCGAAEKHIARGSRILRLSIVAALVASPAGVEAGVKEGRQLLLRFRHREGTITLISQRLSSNK